MSKSTVETLRLKCHISLYIPLFNLFSGPFFNVRKTIKTNKQQKTGTSALLGQRQKWGKAS